MFSQTAESTCEFWVNPVKCTFLAKHHAAVEQALVRAVEQRFLLYLRAVLLDRALGLSRGVDMRQSRPLSPD